MSHTYQYPRPAVAADIVAFSTLGGQILLIERGHEPYKGDWALPGGHVEPGEDLAVCAARELKEETGVDVKVEHLIQIGAFGKPGRDPRGDAVSVAFLTYLPPGIQFQAGDDAAKARWFPLNALPHLAFDHGDIIAAAIKLSGPNPYDDEDLNEP